MFLADMNIGEGALFSVFAILIVFLVLALLVLSVSLLSKIKFKEEKEVKKAPVVAAVQKKFTAADITDEDMMVAALVATADFIEETKVKDAKVVSIKRIG